MGISYHHIYAADGLGFTVADRVFQGTVSATYAAAAQGASSTIAVSWTEPVPTPYTAVASMVEDATWYITAKTALGFTLNVAPRTALLTLAGGTVRILIVS